MLNSSDIVNKMRSAQQGDPTLLSIVPEPDLKRLGKSGSASIDLRLGRWFATMRQSRFSDIKIPDDEEGEESEPRLMREYFVRYGERFVLHPSKFVLGITLEWIRLPKSLAAYVTGRSSLGRRGLIIETAAGIHPGFTGCLALEMTNVGEVPISIEPGTPICQVFFHEVDTVEEGYGGQFIGRRKPRLGKLKRDRVLESLSGDIR